MLLEVNLLLQGNFALKENDNGKEEYRIRRGRTVYWPQTRHTLFVSKLEKDSPPSTGATACLISCERASHLARKSSCTSLARLQEQGGKMLNEVFRLHKIGLALQWLKHKSKHPLNTAWTRGPRASLADLKKQYDPKRNLGTRLGSVALVGDRYLAVTDIDVKSPLLRHREEAYACLEEHFPGVANQAPKVETGRGNGSAHLYIKTKEPAKPRRISQSSEKVKVLMPSVEPSKHERETLTQKEIEKGYRLRPAWEVSLMGEGQQTVLPPSIHPDTGRQYKWDRPLETIAQLPLIVCEYADSKAPNKELKRDSFSPVNVTLEGTELDDSIISMIKDGSEVEDRSAALMAVTIAMVRVGLKDQEIETILTDKKFYLGNVAYDHVKSGNRSKAANWIRKYTIKKAREEHDAAFQFRDDYEEEPSKPGKVCLDRNHNGKPRSTLKNIVLAITKSVGRNAFQRNEFSSRDFHGLDAPWGRKKGESITDQDIIDIKMWVAKAFGFEAPKQIVLEAVAHIAGQNRFHPVREYLDSLVWDGKKRVDSWLKTYMNAYGPEPYLSHVSRKFLCSMIGRVKSPGIKFDHVLILEGPQGIGKSTVGRLLAGDDWFCDTMADVKDKDAMLNLQGAWIVEISELSTLRKSDSETYKAFFSRQSDRVRAPYGMRWEDNKRQCIFIGTTNSDAYLKDKTGNRRFWPVRVNQCEFEKLLQDRDQLFAEALAIWKKTKEPLYLEGEAKAQAEKVQKMRVAEDDESLMLDAIQDFYSRESKKPKGERFNFKRFRLKDLFDAPGGLSDWQCLGKYPSLAASALRAAGFENWYSNGRSFWRKGITRNG